MSEQALTTGNFDYSGLDPEARIVVEQRTTEIKSLMRRTASDIVEVGEPKAWALMRRYNAAFGLDAQMRHGPFDAAALEPYARDRDWFTLVAGCVDNAAARRDIHQAVNERLGRVWWLDCGNHEQSGQVVLGNDTHIAKPDITALGFCQALPAPSVVHPELLEAPAVPDAIGLSCADLALADVQSLMVNQAVAGWAASYIARLLISHDLDVYATYFDLVAGSARSLAITQEVSTP